MASRRRLLIVFLVSIGGACALGSRAPPTRRSLLKRSLALVSFPTAAHANWLTSRPLEQLRKLEQEAADAKYGELAPIDDGRGGGQRLVPILKLQAQIARIAAGAREPSRWPELRVELSSPSLRTQQMKKDFNVRPSACVRPRSRPCPCIVHGAHQRSYARALKRQRARPRVWPSSGLQRQHLLRG